MNYPTPDIPKLRKYVEWVEEQEALPVKDRQWEQKHYVWTRKDAAVLRESCLIVTLNEPQLAVDRSCGSAFCVAGKVQFDETGLEDGVSAEGYARKALGLNPFQAAELFSANNSAADIRAYAERIAGEPL